jgi:hypothetical protein
VIETKGDIWDLYDSGVTVVVTTNQGHDRNGINNMGAGVVLQAWSRFPELAGWWGSICTAHKARAPVTWNPARRLIAFPVKPYVPEQPEYSWNQRASLELIEISAKQLADLREPHGEIALALPGCGNGGLDQDQVLPILRHYLRSDRFVLVDRRLRR